MMYHFVRFSNDECLTILKSFDSKGEADVYHNNSCYKYNGVHVDVISDAYLSEYYH